MLPLGHSSHLNILHLNNLHLNNLYLEKNRNTLKGKSCKHIGISRSVSRLNRSVIGRCVFYQTWTTVCIIMTLMNLNCTPIGSSVGRKYISWRWMERGYSEINYCSLSLTSFERVENNWWCYNRTSLADFFPCSELVSILIPTSWWT